jgi:hypothetical protein
VLLRQQALVLILENFVALSLALFDFRAIVHGNIAAIAIDQLILGEFAKHLRHAFPAYSQNFPQRLLSDNDCVVWHAVNRH